MSVEKRPTFQNNPPFSDTGIMVEKRVYCRKSGKIRKEEGV